MMDSPIIAMPEIVSPAALIERLEYVDGLYIYGLVDAAQFPELLRYAPSAIKSGNYVSLLGESALGDAILVGPLLIDLTINFQQRALALKWLLSELQHRPFVSFLTSAQPLSILMQHLRWLTDVKHEDNTEWVMRYYDPRILPHWLSVLTPEQHLTALQGIRRWGYCDVRGQWQVLHGVSDEALPVPGEPMLLTATQHEALLQKCLPYAVMDMLQDDDASQLEAVQPTARYDFMAMQIGKAQGYGLDGIADLKTYCMLALLYGPDFDAFPEVQQALLAPLGENVFTTRISGWTSAQWDALAKGKTKIQ